MEVQNKSQDTLVSFEEENGWKTVKSHRAKPKSRFPSPDFPVATHNPFSPLIAPDPQAGPVKSSKVKWLTLQYELWELILTFCVDRLAAYPKPRTFRLFLQLPAVCTFFKRLLRDSTLVWEHIFFAVFQLSPSTHPLCFSSLFGPSKSSSNSIRQLFFRILRTRGCCLSCAACSTVFTRRVLPNRLIYLTKGRPPLDEFEFYTERLIISGYYHLDPNTRDIYIFFLDADIYELVLGAKKRRECKLKLVCERHQDFLPYWLGGGCVSECGENLVCASCNAVFGTYIYRRSVSTSNIKFSWPLDDEDITQRKREEFRQKKNEILEYVYWDYQQDIQEQCDDEAFDETILEMRKSRWRKWI